MDQVDLQLCVSVNETESCKNYLKSNTEAEKLHKQAINSFVYLADDEKCKQVLLEYNNAIECADFRPIMTLFSDVQNADLIVRVAQGNYFKQIDRLLIGALDIQNHGRATVNNYGIEKTFRTLEEIETELYLISEELRVTNDLAEMSKDEPQRAFAATMSGLERYMYDGGDLTTEKENRANTTWIIKSKDSEFVNNLQREFIIPSNTKLLNVNIESEDLENINNETLVTDLPFGNRLKTLERVNMANNGDRETDNIFLKTGKIPDTVIINIPSKDFLSLVGGEGYALQCMFIDWFRLPYKNRPVVIMYTNGFTSPLHTKFDYQGFLFCDTPDELRNTLKIARRFKQNQDSEIYNPSKLEKGQKDAYDNSDLREWENQTADTFQSLEHIIKRFQFRNFLINGLNPQTTGDREEFSERKKSIIPEKPIKTILDLGTGEGRIAGILARLGYNVMGLDISSEQLAKSRERIHEEGEGLRGEKDYPGLSYHALRKLEKVDLMSNLDINLSDEETRNHYLTVQGSFFELQSVLNDTLIEWNNRYTSTDRYSFFGTSPSNMHAFSEEINMFSNVGFDVAMFNWHTFCEIGSPENQKKVLEQVLNVLSPGGELILEIPDRTIEPYASALREYHTNYPEEPYGTIRDRIPNDFQGLEGETLYPPRYFPDINEIVILLKSLGFDIDERDVLTYPVIGKDEKSGQKTLVLKENFITARKPRW